ncbi:MAG: cytochrome c oxidase subunit II [Acidimicrobiales bacterium]|nr:cytochrome c oxidase subunit II [Acidimicrobiales bacterium]
MSDAEQSELTPEEQHQAANHRGKMPLLAKIFGVLTVGATTAVLIGSIYAVFDQENKPLNGLNPQGPKAQTIQNLVLPVFVVAGIVMVIVCAAVLFISWKFRRRTDEDPHSMGVQTEGNMPLELTWTAIPALILFAIAIGTIITSLELEPKVGPETLEVRVIGQQWWWSYEYDLDQDGNFDDLVTANELVVPTGRDVNLRITSNDVIHSYWIPELNGKKDAVPGQINDWALRADEVGTYLGTCTEFCGLSHANMRMLVRSVSPDDFDAWVEGQQREAVEPAEGSLAAEGKKVFEAQLCSSCHLIRGVNEAKVEDPEKGVDAQLVSGNAPDLTHFASRGTFAGAIYNSRYPNPDGNDQPYGATCTAEDTDACGEPLDNATPGNPDNPFYAPNVENWLRDPVAMKPMAPLQTENPYADGRVRGMPNLGLSEDQIDQLVAYLETLR